MSSIDDHLICPACRYENPLGSSRCVLCQLDLEADGSEIDNALSALDDYAASDPDLEVFDPYATRPAGPMEVERARPPAPPPRRQRPPAGRRPPPRRPGPSGQQRRPGPSGQQRRPPPSNPQRRPPRRGPPSGAGRRPPQRRPGRRPPPAAARRGPPSGAQRRPPPRPAPAPAPESFTPQDNRPTRRMDEDRAREEALLQDALYSEMPDLSDPTATRRADALRPRLSDLETRNEPLSDDTPFPLGDLDTQAMDQTEIVKAAESLRDSDKLQLALSNDSSPAVAEGLARTEAPESDLPLPIPEREPQPAPPPVVIRRGGRAGWMLAALLGAVVLALAATLYKDHSSRPLVERAQRFRLDVRQSLASSRAIVADESGIADLREELSSLERLGGERLDLSEARAGVLTLEGLLGLAKNEKLAAETAVRERLDMAPGCESALRGGLAMLAREKGAIDQLSLAIAEGIGRPELRGWRARARQTAGLDSPQVARAALSDLSAVAATNGGRLPPEYVELEIHALIAIGERDEAAALLKNHPELGETLGWSLTLSRIESLLDQGQAREALAVLDREHAGLERGGDGSERSTALARRTLEAAVPQLDSLRQGLLGQDERSELLAQLHLTKRLGSEPVPDEVIDTLLVAVEAAADGKAKIPGELCLAAASLGPPEVRRRVLVVIYRRLVASRSSDEQLELNLLLCLIVGAETPSRLPGSSELLSGLSDPETRFELLLARALAWESFGGRWLRRALADLSKARKLRPDDPEVEEARRRILDRLRSDPAGKRS